MQGKKTLKQYNSSFAGTFLRDSDDCRDFDELLNIPIETGHS